jgi:ubiquinone/menaquinone biosynthesis C-methylase UbiE
MGKNDLILIANQEKCWDEFADIKKFTTPFIMMDFEKYVSLGSNILDVGCGYGRTLNELYKKGYENLTGVDFSNEMIKKGLKMNPNLNLLKNNGDDLPFETETFDSVILIGVLTSNVLNKKQTDLISEISRVLKEKGILYISDFLLNEDERNLKRYDRYKDKYNIYGIFKLPEGLILRHHSIEHIKELTKNYNTLLFQKEVFNTMNGHQSNGFHYIGQKKQ